jgi:hypothetical protein
MDCGGDNQHDGGSAKFADPPSHVLFGLHRESDRYLAGPVEDLKQMIADQTTILALGLLAARHFNAAIASPALGTDDVGLSHSGKITSRAP